jgi:hypothetical protein
MSRAASRLGRKLACPLRKSFSISTDKGHAKQQPFEPDFRMLG